MSPAQTPMSKVFAHVPDNVEEVGGSESYVGSQWIVISCWYSFQAGAG